MKELFQALAETLEAGRDAVLCGIMTAFGPAPRGAGSKMLVREDGTTLGTIGGGAVERTAAREALEVLEKRSPRVRAFSLTSGEAESVGMICGGNVTVYYQLFAHGDARAHAALRRALEDMDGGGNAWWITRLDAGVPVCSGVYDAERGLQFLSGLAAERLRPLLKTRAVYAEGEPAYFVEPVARAGIAYLFGGGHVGRALAPVLSRVDFRVAVYDDREGMARAENFPTAERVILGDYRRLGEHVTLTENDCAVVLTQGHQADYEVLEQVLRTPVAYVGCIGSRQKAEAIRNKLLENGFSPECVARIHSPVGLAIAAETPDEIAVSIVAEMIACRAALRG